MDLQPLQGPGRQDVGQAQGAPVQSELETGKSPHVARSASCFAHMPSQDAGEEPAARLHSPGPCPSLGCLQAEEQALRGTVPVLPLRRRRSKRVLHSTHAPF